MQFLTAEAAWGVERGWAGGGEDFVKTAEGAVAESGVGRRLEVEEALDFCQVVVDVSPPNYIDGEPALSLYKKALARGFL